MKWDKSEINRIVTTLSILTTKKIAGFSGNVPENPIVFDEVDDHF